ncbi:MAG TPA: pitrilysin family protein [Candidatus Eremiobacteraeota bacterium]|nr:MAG: Insulinase (Peptidase family M16) [bacterium ADurb.Bin363]HPZ09227.1 pitrilysin family protein [Candidatus Eremiobacteraeota bacterium]
MKKFYAITSILLLIILISGYASAAMPDENMKRHVFDNGLVVITHEKHDNPLVSIHIWVRCGSIYENSDKRGISHFYEHMIFRGTNEVRVGEINRSIEKWGGTVNAVTSKDYTQYYFVVNKKYALDALKLLSEGVINTQFDPTEMELERNIVLEELNRTVNNPENYVIDMFNKSLMNKNPYRWPVIGFDDTVRSINREDFIKYQKSYYRPNNMCVVIIGDFETQKILPEVKSIFSRFENAVVPTFQMKLDDPQEEITKIQEDMGLPQATIVFGYQGPGILNTSEDICVVDVLAFLLGQGQSSRLYRELKEEKGIVAKLQVVYYTSRYPSPFLVWAVTDRNKIDVVEKELNYQFNRLIEEPVTDEELNRAKVLLESTYIFGNETNDGLANSYGFYEILADNVNFSKTYVEDIHKVTKEDIMRVAKKYFGSGNYTIAILK